MTATAEYNARKARNVAAYRARQGQAHRDRHRVYMRQWRAARAATPTRFEHREAGGR